MTDETQGWHPAQPTMPLTPAGWYPDPWSSGHHRYWDGAGWTGGSFPHGPAPGGGEGTDAVWAPPPPPLPPPRYAPALPPPPEWSPPAAYSPWGASAPTEEWRVPPAPAPKSPMTGIAFVALVLGVMVVVGSLGALGGYLAFRHRPRPGPSVSGPAFTPPGTTDPSASALDSLVLQQADVDSTVLVQPNSDSGQFSAGAPTLDLCNAAFPSEALRTARVQVTAFNGTPTALLSTEAVLYRNAAGTQQAFEELKSAAANCPTTPVPSPVGEATVATQFNAAPDVSWAATPTVTRQAYDFTFTDGLSSPHHRLAVYLRRGRALMGVYFSEPDTPQITVAGQNTIEKIAGVFAARMAALPDSIVNG